ncbi:MAG: hypothetical protein IKV47_07350 [Oscillospiraceae bacterium]|nr:hypothetical protein [Oscillospiraceae bacterium]MBR5261968.1 hypothetical protein [Oscillospiraceae bacterium]
MKKKNRIRSYMRPAAFVFAVVCVLAFFLAALGNLDVGQQEEGKMQLDRALRRAAVACYAAEGIYPPSLEYMEEYYGIQIDHSRYTVVYDVFAENLMPDITVLER